MLRKLMILTAVVLFLSVCRHAEAAQTGVSWDGGGDGQSWPDPNNWDPNIVPCNNSADVTISAAGYLRIGLLQSCTVNQLDCYGDSVEIAKRTPDWSQFVPYRIQLELTDPNGLTNHGSLGLEAEDGLSIVGNVTNTTDADLEFWGRLEINHGDLYNDANATIEVGGEDIGVDNGRIDNRGTIDIDPESEFWADHTLHNDGNIYMHGSQCHSDHMIDNNSNGLLMGFGILYADESIQNKGKIIAFGGTLSVATQGPFMNAGLLQNNPTSRLYFDAAADTNNHGRINVHAGGAIGFSSNLVNEPNATVQLLGGTLAAMEITQRANANFSGFGGITGHVVIEPNGIVQLTGPTNIVGDVNIAPGATLEISDGQTLITGYTTCKGTIRLRGVGTVVFQGGWDCDQCNLETARTCWDATECAAQPNGDATCDGSVNLADLFALKADFGKCAPWTDPECCADFTQDGCINLGDLFALKAGFGASCYTPSTGNQNCPP